MQSELAPYLDAFVAAADGNSFSAAARRLGLTPAAVSKSVARLEAGLGVRLFQRNTRSLSLTGEGERLYRQVRTAWGEIGDALTEVRQGAGRPAGTLKVSLAPAVGRHYFVPLLHGFTQRYPDIVPDLRFENRQVDLVGEGYDVAIGGGIALTEGLVARELARVRVVLAASPDYLARHPAPATPDDLARHHGVLRRSIGSGRLVPWVLRDGDGCEVVASVRPVAVLDDPEAMASAAACGLGIAMLPLPHALPLLDSGQLVRVLPGWYAETGPLSIYYASRRLMPATVRAFVDYVVDEVRERGLGVRFAEV
ncbi:transcriptional regulator, LysR family [Pseudoduganella flava]|uniref:LysR family transcriptional regulator n=1 Tax=Pseudoduganella flava TaxID=871742 RepID=A0A562Q0U7_9BURK|nr:LysR family transcriptional regulator [Pseudoduganella flava]QGZ38163.1 LysR family transcriptional regulator [Pseudoduganella flava]TWI50315.1 transcriptional regulator, LysR family [Pseudoduganella flava]